MPAKRRHLHFLGFTHFYDWAPTEMSDLTLHSPTPDNWVKWLLNTDLGENPDFCRQQRPTARHRDRGVKAHFEKA